MAKSISIVELKDVVKTLEEEILPLLEGVKNLNEVQDGISSIDLETGKEDKRAEKNKESEGMGVVNTKEKELLNKQEELIKVYKQLEKLQDEKVKELTQEHEEEKKSWLQEEEFKERKLERLEYDLIEYEYRLQCKICIEEDLVNLRDELEEKRRQQVASKDKELRLLRTELKGKKEELKKLAEELEAERQKEANQEINKLRLEHEEERKLWIKEEEFMERKLEIVKEDLIECEYRLQCKICVEEDLANLRDELEEKGRQQEARYEKELQILRNDLETERGMRRQMEASKEEELPLLRTELEAKEEELKKMTERQKEASKEEELELPRAELEEKEEELKKMREGQKTAASKKPTTNLKQYLLSKIMRRQQEAKDRRGRTTLHRAAMRGDTHRVQLLLDAGSQVNAVDNAGCTPLWLAAWQDRQDACRALLAAGARPDVKGGYFGRTALHEAALCGHPAVCELLLAAGARPNEPDDLNQWTALHCAALHGHAPVVLLLLQHGAERGARNEWGQTALDLASECGHTEVAAMLQD